ncbi:hypothetical protein ACFQY0_00890 [Haloferula chungangensis]|uniref:Uncharacterized protein n=1 Tax=Haloferula chungangensis TaxID=1048331 RepID=A0ABW2L049_9BACT
MSPLPKKKKTPEELAALRESLGISSDGPPPGPPGMMAPAPAAMKAPAPAPPLPEKKVEKPPVTVEEPVIKVEATEPTPSLSVEEPVLLDAEVEDEARSAPLKSLRKSERLPVDRPKKVSKDSGKLPTRRHREGERIPLKKATKPVSAGGVNLPTRKHSDEELARLRRNPLPGVESPALLVASQTAGVLLLIGIYGLGVILMIVAALGAIAANVSKFDLPFEWLQTAVDLPNYSMILFGIMGAGVAVMLLGALWIYFKKPMSQVHAALLTIVAVLVLVFGTLYFFPELHGA